MALIPLFIDSLGIYVYNETCRRLNRECIVLAFLVVLDSRLDPGAMYLVQFPEPHCEGEFRGVVRSFVNGVSSCEVQWRLELLFGGGSPTPKQVAERWLRAEILSGHDLIEQWCVLTTCVSDGEFIRNGRLRLTAQSMFDTASVQHCLWRFMVEDEDWISRYGIPFCRQAKESEFVAGSVLAVVSPEFYGIAVFDRLMSDGTWEVSVYSASGFPRSNSEILLSTRHISLLEGELTKTTFETELGWLSLQ